MNEKIMTLEEYKDIYCDYFQILETDLLKVKPYITFESNNYLCYSNEFIKLYQAICSEIDVICKEYAKFIKLQDEIEFEKIIDIKTSSKYIIHKQDGIINEKVTFTINNDKFIPWSNWNNGSPLWWKQYNFVKHNRSGKSSDKYNYQHANLGNVIKSLAALYILEKYFYKDIAEKYTDISKWTPDLFPNSKVFDRLDFEKVYIEI